MKENFFIYGYNGYLNVGDDSMIYAVVEKLNKSYDSPSFSVLSQKKLVVPEEINNIKFVEPNIFKVLQEIRRSSAVIIGGGTHFYDYYGKRLKTLKIHILLYFLLTISKILNKKIYIIGNGIGPLNDSFNKFTAKKAFQIADFISVRDKCSYGYLKEWKLLNKSVLSFDLAMLLDTENKMNKSSKKVLGVSITPFNQIYLKNFDNDLKLVKNISIPLKKWIKENKNAEINLFVFHGGLNNGDLELTNILYKLLDSNDRVKIIKYSPNPLEMLNKVGKCDLFIGMKYHASVFAYMNQLPLLIINYHPKCYNLANEIELTEDAILEPEFILENRFPEVFKEFINNPRKFMAKLAFKQAKQKAKESFCFED